MGRSLSHRQSIDSDNYEYAISLLDSRETEVFMYFFSCFYVGKYKFDFATISWL